MTRFLKFPEDADVPRMVPNPYDPQPGDPIEIMAYGHDQTGKYREGPEARKARHDQARRLGHTHVRSPVDFSDEPVDPE